MRKIIYITILFTIICCKSTHNKLVNIQGSWATNKDENVSFTISKDSIYYPDYEGKFNIKIQNNFLEVIEENHLINRYYIVKASKDSLILKLDDSKLLKYCKIND